MLLHYLHHNDLKILNEISEIRNPAYTNMYRALVSEGLHRAEQ
jgi:hypothetical protein